MLYSARLMEVNDIFGYDWGAYAPRVLCSAPSPNTLCLCKLNFAAVEKATLQQGMNYRAGKDYSMSPRPAVV